MITDFVKREILKRIGQGYYRINPHLIAKGDWSSIRKVQITWTEDSLDTKIEMAHENSWQFNE